MKLEWLAVLPVVAMAAATGDEDEDPSLPARFEQAPGRFAFVEVIGSAGRAFVEQPLEWRLRFGLEAEFLRDHVIPLLRRPLDVPVQVQVAWMEELDGFLPWPSGEPEPGATGSGAGASFALNGGMSRALALGEVDRGGRSFLTFELRRRMLPVRSGEWTLAAPVLKLAYASRFAEDVLFGRRPADRHDAEVAGAPVALAVEALPEAGRPEDFSGAVGRFTLRASVDTHDLALDRTFELTLQIEGEGNFGRFELPPWQVEGFHRFGVLEDVGLERHTAVCEVAPLRAGPGELPAFRLTYFDPGPPARYRSAESEAIAVRVEGEQPAPQSPTGASPRALVLAGLILLPWLLVLVLWSRLRAARRAIRTLPLADPSRVATPATLPGPARRAPGPAPATPVSDPVLDLLSQRLATPLPALISRDLRETLTGAGLSESLAARTADFVESTLAERYGGPEVPDRETRASALRAELLEAWSRVREGMS